MAKSRHVGGSRSAPPEKSRQVGGSRSAPPEKSRQVGGDVVLVTRIGMAMARSHNVGADDAIANPLLVTRTTSAPRATPAATTVLMAEQRGRRKPVSNRRKPPMEILFLNNNK